MAFDQGYADALAENETLRQELADAHQRIANLSAQCNRNTEQLGRRQREAAERDADLRSTQQMVVRADRAVVDAEAERDAMCEVVETAKAVRELWRYDAMAAAEPEIHAFVAAVDALPTKVANRYLSTACLHAVEPGREHLHRECQSDTTRHDGTHKIGASCKWCEAPCVCRCHVSTKDGV